MQYKKETSFDQLLNFWMRAWSFVRARIDWIDGNEVIAAVRASKDPQYPFWKKLGEALDELRHKLAVEQIGPAWELAGDKRRNHGILRSLRSQMPSSDFIIDEKNLPTLVDPDGLRQNATVVGFLHINQKLDIFGAKHAAESRGYKLAPPDIAVRIAYDYCRNLPRNLFNEIWCKAALPLLFIDSVYIGSSMTIISDTDHKPILTGMFTARMNYIIAVIVKD